MPAFTHAWNALACAGGHGGVRRWRHRRGGRLHACHRPDPVGLRRVSGRRGLERGDRGEGLRRAARGSGPVTAPALRAQDVVRRAGKLGREHDTTVRRRSSIRSSAGGPAVLPRTAPGAAVLAPARCRAGGLRTRPAGDGSVTGAERHHERCRRESAACASRAGRPRSRPTILSISHVLPPLAPTSWLPAAIAALRGVPSPHSRDASDRPVVAAHTRAPVRPGSRRRGTHAHRVRLTPLPRRCVAGAASRAHRDPRASARRTLPTARVASRDPDSTRRTVQKPPR